MTRHLRNVETVSQVLGCLVVAGVLACACTSKVPQDPADAEATDETSDVAAEDDAASAMETEPNPLPNESPIPMGEVLGDPTKVVIIDTETGLPSAPAFASIQAGVDGDDLRVGVLPVAGARDYRIFEVPQTTDIIDLDEGAFAINQGTFRCAGLRYAPMVISDGDTTGAPEDEELGQTTVVGNVQGVQRSLADATLGYAFATEQPGTVALYALGSPFAASDNQEYEANGARWQASRVKRYTSSATLRQTLLAAGWRDDGVIAFVPPAPQAGAALVHEHRYGDGDVENSNNQAPDTSDPGGVIYFTGAESSARPNKVPGFYLFDAPGAGRLPLMRVHYAEIPRAWAGPTHDELVLGEGSFEVIRWQGATAVPRLLWPGLTTKKRYVIEALDAVCPYQGMAVFDADATGDYDGSLRRTLPQMRAQSAHGELYINGQGATTSKPKVLARAVLEAEPGTTPLSAMKFFADFKDDSLFAGATGSGDDLDYRYENDKMMMGMIIMDWWSWGVHQGELWTAFSEANGSNGKMRLTPKTTVTLSADTFVHATMSVDSVTSARRYPQMLISDADVPLPVQALEDSNMDLGKTVVVHPFASVSSSPNDLEIQLCDHRGWDVNDQCPSGQGKHITTNEERILPHAELHEGFSMFWRNRWDVYVSTTRVYVFYENRPYLCTILPTPLKAGPGAHVSFGAVLYHADTIPDFTTAFWNTFHMDRERYTTRRQLDNLGFTDAVPAPQWNETLLPCTTSFQ